MNGIILFINFVLAREMEFKNTNTLFMPYHY